MTGATNVKVDFVFVLIRFVSRRSFWRGIEFYIAFSLAIAFFGSVQSLCFALASRKMSTLVKVRCCRRFCFSVAHRRAQNELYRAIIVQDIAYFDGANSGDLTSRLSGDVYAMVQPVQSALATLLSSFVMLAGGLVMCLYTSWRLSILAFTTIGPIVLVYRVYAKWSGQINKEIWAAYGLRFLVRRQKRPRF